MSEKYWVEFRYKSPRVYLKGAKIKTVWVTDVGAVLNVVR